MSASQMTFEPCIRHGNLSLAPRLKTLELKMWPFNTQHRRAHFDRQLIRLQRRASIQFVMTLIATTVMLSMWIFVPIDSSLPSNIIATAVAALSIPYAYLTERKKTRARIACVRWHAKYCSACGYNVRFTHDRCPECGFPKAVACPTCGSMSEESASAE
jgi:hypothetical protein